MWAFPFNISATSEASDFKFGTQLGFAKAQRKSGHGPGLGELPQILWFPYNISAMPEASDFKIGKRLGFAKAYHKIPYRKKMDVALG